MSTLNPSRYTYRSKLPVGGLRVLKLRPSTSVLSEVDCELVEVTQADLTSGAVVYEALSWCWGAAKFARSLRIHVDHQVFHFPISSTIESALRALRKEHSVRCLWIDALCINQGDTEERNEQVPNMNQIYKSAENVCIWLGESDENSHMAFEFIKTELLSLWGFDKLCENQKMSEQWAAFLTLMKRPWFSRRWVVQEIALANRGTLHCGRDNIGWQDFADAVSLVVEVGMYILKIKHPLLHVQNGFQSTALGSKGLYKFYKFQLYLFHDAIADLCSKKPLESATHRLSEVMKRDEKFDHIPEFFGHIPALGAALLVDATSNLFRRSKDDQRDPLLSLEYLVSRLLHDKIRFLPLYQFCSRSILVPGVGAISPLGAYRVDYQLPVVDVYKDFIDFSIKKSEPTRALDIIRRPWAPRILHNTDRAESGEALNGSASTGLTTDAEPKDNAVKTHPLPSWIPNLDEAAFKMHPHPTAGLRMERKNSDPLVGMPGIGQRNYSAAGTRSVALPKLKFKRREHFFSLFVEGFVLDEVQSIQEPSRLGNIPSKWLAPGGWHDTDEDPPAEFWRTLVADRGPNGQNPPTFYPRACKESIKKILGTTLETKLLINEGRCTIIAEFLRRVQAVIWNRSLMKTKRGHLGLVHENAGPGDCMAVVYLSFCAGSTSRTRILKRNELATSKKKRKREKEKNVQKAAAIFKNLAKDKPRLRKREKLQQEQESRKMNNFVQKCLNFAPLLWLVNVALYIEVWHNWRLAIALVASSCVLLLTSPRWKVNRRKHHRKTNSWNQIVGWVGNTRSTWLLLIAVRFWPWHSSVLETLIVVATHFEQWRSWILETTVILMGFLLFFHQPPSLASKARPSVMTSSASFRRLKSLFTRSRVSQAISSGECYWRLIGECYVHGFMNGKAIRLQNREDIKAQTFELR